MGWNVNQTVWIAVLSQRGQPRAPSGFVGTHDGVPDEVDAGSGRIMELSDGRDQPGRMQGWELVTRSFLLTQKAGWGEQGNQAWLCPLPACLSERASKRQIGRGQYCFRGPVVIDPLFSSAWALLITILTPLLEQNIRDVSA